MEIFNSIFDTKERVLSTIEHAASPYEVYDEFYRDIEADTNLFFLLRTGESEVFEDADGGEFLVREGNFVLTVYARQSWMEISNNKTTFQQKVHTVRSALKRAGLNVTDILPIGDVDNTGFMTYAINIFAIYRDCD